MISKDDRKALAFVVLSFGITWALWLPMLLRPDDFRFLHYVGSLGPAVAAIISVASSPLGIAGVDMTRTRPASPTPEMASSSS